MIADKIVIENNEIVFRVDVETMASNAYSKMVDIQADVNENASEVSSNTTTTLLAKESVDQSLSTVLQAKNDVTIKASQVTLDAEQVTLDAEQVATDRGIVSTNLGLTETAKTEAQTAAVEITDKIDFTGLQQGDLLRHNGTKLVRINESDFLKSKVPFHKSINSGMNDLNSAKIWDGFIREGTGSSIAVGVADSGQSYVQLEGTNVVNGGTDRKYLTGSGVVGIQNIGLLNSSSSAGFTVEVGSLANSGGNRYGLVMWVDSNNWMKLVVSASTIYILKKVAGAESIPFSLNLSFSHLRVTQNLIISYTSQNNTISARHVNTGQLVSPISCSDIIANGNDLTYIGLTGTITNWILFNQPTS